MNIGIIGAGMIGGTLAKLFTQVGHQVAISNSREPETLSDLVAELGPHARAMTAEDAAEFGEVVVDAIPYGQYGELPSAALAGRILISASNYYPKRDGVIEFGDDAQTEHLAKTLPKTRVVKAFNTIYFKHLGNNGDVKKPEGDRQAIFIAGDDMQAKELVADLIRQIGFGPVDTGSLHHSKMQEPGAPVYTKALTVAEAREMLATVGSASA